jgi:hypothetical protein
LSLFTYNPESVNVLIAGLVNVTGFVDGTFVDVTKDVVPFSAARTADGTVARMYNNDQTYTITLTLHCGSNSNDVLTKLWQLDEITQRGKFHLLIKDFSGSDLFFSTTTWIEGIPTISKSNGIDSRIWVLRSSQATTNVGGNMEPSKLLEDITNLAISSLPAIEGIL